MSLFITRVELHEPNNDSYNILHDAMLEAGFSKSIKGNDGKNYKLPTAEYFLDKKLTTSQVYDLTTSAAKSTNKNFSFIVTLMDSCLFKLDLD